MTSVDSDDWAVECSDEERYNGDQSPDHTTSWHPPVEDIIRLYDALNESGCVDFEWKCPGRRAPSPQVDSHETEKGIGQPAAAAHDKKKKTATQFDFDDGFGDLFAEKITPRRITGGSTKLKGSGQKRVASFKNVMSDIRRQMHMEQLDSTPGKGGAKDARKAAPKRPEMNKK